MVTNQDTLDAELLPGKQSIWCDVYRIIRCPESPCHHKGQHSWQDLEVKRHHRLKKLNRKALQGGLLETHDDVPDSVCEQLYTEENRRLDKTKKDVDHSTMSSMCPPINIKNLLAAGTSQQSIPTTSANEDTPAKSSGAESIMVHELPNLAAEEEDTNGRDNIKKARDVTLENCVDLMQYARIKPQFLFQARRESTRGPGVRLRHCSLSDMMHRGHKTWEQ
ncbi:hypothetical protein N7540_013141 [Penicillium herquei]|nr:hypothetical protein N7540_013141 [Penicillium herquei]